MGFNNTPTSIGWDSIVFSHLTRVEFVSALGVKRWDVYVLMALKCGSYSYNGFNKVGFICALGLNKWDSSA